jgi:hypothetical protein
VLTPERHIGDGHESDNVNISELLRHEPTWIVS